MTRTAVRVAIRTRPTSQFAQDQIVIDTEKQSIQVRSAETGDVVSNKQDNWVFKFHQVLHNVSQDTVYDSVCNEIVAGVIAGRNGTIMAYGQTGAGKTFTMIGDTRNYKHRGIAPRALAQLFGEIQSRAETEFHVQCSYMELYNERIFDLLAEDVQEHRSDYVIAEDRDTGATTVKGLTMVTVNSEEEALNLLFQGEVFRTTAEHQLNKSSNRSHCIFTVHVTQRSRLGSAEKVLNSKLNLVDLAGSERLKKTMAEEEMGGKSLDDTIKRESMYINKSLTYLEQCVVALTDKNRNHVPYRQTKLTNVLKDSLGGNCNTLMIACIWGEPRHIEETISTLKLASRMMHVHNQSVTNVSLDPTLLVKKYEKEIKLLKQELLMHDALAERGAVVYEEYTPEQQRELNAQLREFLFCPPEQEEAKTVQIDSVRKMTEILRQVKIIVRNVQTETEERLRGQFSFTAKGGQAGGAASARGPGADGKAGEAGHAGGQVGDLDESGGYGLGTAPAGARPAGSHMPTGAASAGSPSKRDKAGAPGAGGDASGAVYADKESAFKAYQADAELGGQLVTSISESKVHVKNQRAQCKELSGRVNDSKARIDRLQRQLADKRADADNATNAGDEVIVDEEEFRLMKELADEKKVYRALFTELRDARSDLVEASNALDGLKTQLLDNFNAWYNEITGVTAEAAAKAAAAAEQGDILDDGEAFDQLELERVAAEDPDSLAYFNARKKMAVTMRSGAGGTTTRRRR